MINVFVIRKYTVLILLPLLIVIGFYVGMIFYNLWIALSIMGGTLLVSAILGNLMLSNPFRRMVEGKGIIVFDINSTGIIKPFIVKVIPPNITGKVNRQPVTDIFDRESVFNLTAPKYEKFSFFKKKDKQPSNVCIPHENGDLEIKLNEAEYNRGRFALFHYPCLVYNSSIKSLLTKDYLSNLESETFTHHTILYLNRKVEELTGVLRDFGRYVVELTKPKGSIFGSKWFWIILIGLFILLGVLFLPSIINQLKGMGASSSSPIGDIIKTNQVVIPK